MMCKVWLLHFVCNHYLPINHQCQSLHLDYVHMHLAIMEKINEFSTSKHLRLECIFFQFTDGTTGPSIPRQNSTELTTLLQGNF